MKRRLLMASALAMAAACSESDGPVASEAPAKVADRTTEIPEATDGAGEAKEQEQASSRQPPDEQAAATPRQSLAIADRSGFTWRLTDAIETARQQKHCLDAGTGQRDESNGLPVASTPCILPRSETRFVGAGFAIDNLPASIDVVVPRGIGASWIDDEPIWYFVEGKSRCVAIVEIETVPVEDGPVPKLNAKLGRTRVERSETANDPNARPGKLVLHEVAAREDADGWLHVIYITRLANTDWFASGASLDLQALISWQENGTNIVCEHASGTNPTCEAEECKSQKCATIP